MILIWNSASTVICAMSKVKICILFCRNWGSDLTSLAQWCCAMRLACLQAGSILSYIFIKFNTTNYFTKHIYPIKTVAFVLGGKCKPHEARPQIISYVIYSSAGIRFAWKICFFLCFQLKKLSSQHFDSIFGEFKSWHIWAKWLHACRWICMVLITAKQAQNQIWAKQII